jgi:NAD(P)-dependent dehydrogenase (short-subunit alcohol dehydrogenase family)
VEGWKENGSTKLRKEDIPMLLKDQIVLITGAGGGLGTAFAKALTDEGAVAVLTDISEQALAGVVKKMEEAGAKYTTFVMDVSNKAQVEQTMAKTVEKYGKIDILLNNAGGSLFTPKKLEDIKEEHWDLVLNVNLKGTFLCCQAAVPYMIERKRGKIINLSSIGGRTPSLVTGVPYAAAKGGIIALTRRLAKEVGSHGINVNAIAPGTVMSGQRMINLWNELTQAQKDDILNSIPLGRLSTAEEQASVVVFLASEMSNYLTGTVIDINGGRLMA